MTFPGGGADIGACSLGEKPVPAGAGPAAWAGALFFSYWWVPPPLRGREDEYGALGAMSGELESRLSNGAPGRRYRRGSICSRCGRRGRRWAGRWRNHSIYPYPSASTWQSLHSRLDDVRAGAFGRTSACGAPDPEADGTAADPRLSHALVPPCRPAWMELESAVGGAFHVAPAPEKVDCAVPCSSGLARCSRSGEYRGRPKASGRRRQPTICYPPGHGQAGTDMKQIKGWPKVLATQSSIGVGVF